MLRSRERAPRIPAGSLVARVPPIYAVAAAIVAGDALGNFHYAISPWLAWTVAGLSLCAFLAARRTLGLAVAYLAMALAANVAVANMLEPRHDRGSVATMTDGSRVTIEAIMNVVSIIFRKPSCSMK